MTNLEVLQVCQNKQRKCPRNNKEKSWEFNMQYSGLDIALTLIWILTNTLKGI